MSRYGIDKALWDVYRDAGLAKAFTDDPGGFLADRELTEDERTAFAGRDVRSLFSAGAHPFLLYNFSLRLEGRFSIPFAVGYVQRLQGLRPGDIRT